MVVITLTYLKPLSEIEKQLVAHRAFLEESLTKGLLIASGPQNPRTGGIILLKGSAEEAQK